MTESTYTVSGMACGHCAGFVTEEIERIAGVTAVAETSRPAWSR